MKGTYTLEYSFSPYERSARADAYACGYSFAYPSAVAIGTDKHKGKLSSFEQYVSFDNEYIRLSALKKAEERSSIIVRFFNTSAEREKLSVKLSALFTAAHLCNLDEVRLADLNTADGKLELEVDAKKIITVELEF